MIPRKIYVASSWRNTFYPEVVAKLREAGHDVYDAYAVNKNIGTTVVIHNSSTGVCELIDGQQRTTTLFLMLCAFRNIYKERGLDTTQKFNLKNMMQDKFFAF